MMRLGAIFGAALALVVTLLMPARPAYAAVDAWGDKINEASRTAERDVARHRIRGASLGDDDATSTRRGRRASVERNQDDEDEPAPRRRKRAASHKAHHAQARVRSHARAHARADDNDRPRRNRSLSGGSVAWTADASCLDGTLRQVIRSLAANYGPVTVNSTCRSRSHNASVGGAPKSYHLRGEAVDFRVHGNVSAVYASLRGNGNVGGLKHYGGGLFHIDTGPRRSW